MQIKLYRFGVTIAASVVLLGSFTLTGQKLEGVLLHLGSRLMPEVDQESSVVVVAIDDNTLETQGDWPWSRDRLAAVVDRISEFKPAAIGVMLSLTETETASGVANLKDSIDTLDPAFQETAGRWLDQLDTDSRLARSLNAADNVVLAASWGRNEKSARHPEGLKAFSIPARHETQPWYRVAERTMQSAVTLDRFNVKPPLALFLHQVSGVGLSADYQDKQWVHRRSLAVEIDGHYLPGLELLLWAMERGIDLADIAVLRGDGLRTADNQKVGAVDLAWYPHPSVAPPVYSLGEVMHSDSLARDLGGKTVLLGLTSTDLAPVLTGPAGNRYAPVTWSAQILASMQSGNSIEMPVWFYAAQRLLVVLFALYFVLVPPAWHGMRGLVASLVVSAVVVNTGLVILIVKNLWLPVILPVCFLVTVQLALMISRHWRRELVSVSRALRETRVELATNLRSQGQLDQAMEQYVQCLPDETVLEPLYELGLEYERHRQVGKAQSIYAKLERCAGGFRDTRQRSTQLAAISERFPSAVSSNPAQTLLLDTPVMERPVLGRYRVERELGRGAMGTVYLAVDPTIGREVAIKTLPLLQECDSAEQAAVAERFFKEAEAVGRLDHPNIVTVYDAGKEHDLAFIAMDYVPGASLDAHAELPDLLPVWEVLEIAAQVADALDYAHRRNVVHRDIKPGNIMYDHNTGVAKITDFGVARLLDASRTRTGTVLGSPSYMSPEQVAGKQTDGRSDLFSLGVTLYQLLSGSLPFKADSLATLMYQIANQKTPPIRKIRPDLPISVSRLINKALQKNSASRFDNGESMATAIRKCRSQFRGGRRKTA
jgi:eukaryotic-like serine/threonine-protein kinase